MSGTISIPIQFMVLTNPADAQAAFAGTKPEDVVTMLQRTNEHRQSELAVAVRRDTGFAFYVVTVDMMLAAKAALAKVKAAPEDQWQQA